MVNSIPLVSLSMGLKVKMKEFIKDWENNWNEAQDTFFAFKLVQEIHEELGKIIAQSIQKSDFFSPGEMQQYLEEVHLLTHLREDLQKVQQINEMDFKNSCMMLKKDWKFLKILQNSGLLNDVKDEDMEYYDEDSENTQEFVDSKYNVDELCAFEDEYLDDIDLLEAFWDFEYDYLNDDDHTADSLQDDEM